MELAKAYVQIIPSAEGISGSISQVLSPEASSAGTEAGESIGTNLVSNLKTIIAGAGIGIAIKKVFDSIGSIAEAGDEIGKTAQKLHVSTDEFQALSFAAEHCGFSTGTFNTAVKKLQSSGYNGSLTDFLDSLMKIDDVSKRNAMAHEVLGDKVANEMAAYINGSKSISDYKGDLESLGGLMSEESIKASESYKDSMLDMQTAMDGVKTHMLETFMPSCSEVMQGVSQIITGDAGGFETIISGVGEFVTTFTTKIVDMLKGLITSITEKLPEMISSGSDMLQSITGILDKLPQWMETAGTLLNDLLNAIMEAMPDMMDSGMEIIMSIIDGIVDNLPEIISTGISIILNLASTILKNLPQILETGVTLIGKLASGLIKAIPKLVGQIPEIISAIKNKFLETNWAQLGKDIINGLINGIKSMLGSVGNAIKDVAGSALKSVKSFLGIKSPSRVFRDQVGKFIPLGIADGINQEIDSVDQAMKNLSNASIEGFGDVDIKTSSDSESYYGIMNILQKIYEKDGTLVFEGREVARMVKKYA